MKKIVTVAAVALFAALVLPSCKKDYTCTCNIMGTSTPHKLEKVSKKDAQAYCDNANAAATIAGGNCSLD